MTELVDAQSTGAIRREDEDRDSYMKSYLTKNQNFLSSDASLGEIKVELETPPALVKKTTRKEEVIFEMELKANINSVKR